MVSKDGMHFAKHQLIEALKPYNIHIARDPNVQELKALAKEKGIKRYYTLRKAELINILNGINQFPEKINQQMLYYKDS